MFKWARNRMKLSIVIICGNDPKVIANCLGSVYEETGDPDFEVTVSDNGSSDGSLEYLRNRFGKVRIAEDRASLGFARGNNAGIRMARGEYVFILAPDTIIRNRALGKLVADADRHPETGAFGCRVLNPARSFQHPARPVLILRGYEPLVRVG